MGSVRTRESGEALGLVQGLLIFSMKGLSLPPMPGDRYGESSGTWKESTGESTLHSSGLSLEVPYSGAESQGTDQKVE